MDVGNHSWRFTMVMDITRRKIENFGKYLHIWRLSLEYIYDLFARILDRGFMQKIFKITQISMRQPTFYAAVFGIIRNEE